MSEFTIMPAKDPDSVEPYFVVWCSKDGTNDGGSTDTGELQGETIATDGVTWTVPAGITKDSDAQTSVTINNVTYSANTVCTIWLSGGVHGTDYDLVCEIDTSGSRTLHKTITVPVRQA